MVHAWIDQPDRAFHRKGVATFLNDGRAFTVILAKNDQRPTDNADRGNIGQRVRGNIGADGGFPCDGAAYRVIDRGREHGAGGRFVGADFGVDAELRHQALGVRCEHVHEMRHGSALIAADIGYAGLQKRFGNGKNAFAFKMFAIAAA